MKELQERAQTVEEDAPCRNKEEVIVISFTAYEKGVDEDCQLGDIIPGDGDESAYNERIDKRKSNICADI